MEIISVITTTTTTTSTTTATTKIAAATINNCSHNSDNHMANVIKDDNLLLNTLKLIWQNYLQSINCDKTIKQHWLQLFLYNFQFTNNAVILENDLWKSFLKSIPEQIYSYFLEEIYEIITKSNVIATTKVITPEIEHVNLLEEFGIENSSDYLQLLKKNHNFAQLILRQPSDCNKIVALRQFLTDQLGQHLLQFFLRIDIKLLTSRESLCNLCITLFPNCSWSETSDDNKINDQLTMSHNSWNSIRLYKLKRNKTDSNIEKIYEIKSSPSSPCLLESYTYVELEDFKSAHRSSDEIALIIIQLLQKFTQINSKYVLLNKEQYSIVAAIYEFTIKCLQRNNATFSSQYNAIFIKYRLTKLLVQCLNNFIMCIKKIEEVEERLLQNVLQQILSILSSLKSENNLYELSYTLLHIVFNLLYNVVAIYNINSTCEIEYQYVFSEKILNENVVEKYLKIMQHLLLNYSPQGDNSLKAIFSETYQLYIETLEELVYNSRLKTARTTITTTTTTTKNSTRYHNEQNNKCLKLSKSKIIIKRKYWKTCHYQDKQLQRQRQQQQQKHQNQKQRQCYYQIHCHLKVYSSAHWACQLQKIFIKLFHLLSYELQQMTIIHLAKYGTCCCHYTLATYQQYFKMLQQYHDKILLQKHLYKFLYYKMLCTLYGRGNNKENNKNISNNTDSSNSNSNISNREQSKNVDIQCLQCFEKSNCEKFEKGLLQLYTQFYNKIEQQQWEHFEHNKLNLLLFLKHIKSSWQYFINHQHLTSGILTNIILSIFRKLTIIVMHNNVNNVTNAENFLNSLQLLIECLNILAICISNDNYYLIKRFFNEENIKHLEDIWYMATAKTAIITTLNNALAVTTPTIATIVIIPIISHVCAIIKVGIEKSRFLGKNLQEQQILQERLITLQFKHTEYITKSFNQHIKCLMNNSNNINNNDDNKEDKNSMTALFHKNIFHILNTLILQWTLTYNLLQASHDFHVKFMKIYQNIFNDNNNEKDNKYDENGADEYINILQLNYTALAAFLLIVTTKSKRRKQCNNDNHYNNNNIINNNNTKKSNHNDNDNILNEIINNAKHSMQMENIIIKPKQTSIPMQSTSLQSLYQLEKENHINLVSSTLTLTLDDNIALTYLCYNIIGKSENKPKSVLVTPNIYFNDIDHFNHHSFNDNQYNQKSIITITSLSSVRVFCELLLPFELSLNCKRNYPSFSNGHISTVLVYNIKNQLKYSAATTATTPATTTVRTTTITTTTTITDKINPFIDNSYAFVEYNFLPLLLHPKANNDNNINNNNGTIADETLNANETNLFNKIFQILDNLIPKFNYTFTSISSPITTATTTPTATGTPHNQKKSYDNKLLIELDDNIYSGCKRLLLKLFEITMAICLRECYQENDQKSNKMQKHLHKLKQVILCNATKNWENYAIGDDSYGNLIMQALQSLLKIASEIMYDKTSTNGKMKLKSLKSSISPIDIDDGIIYNAKLRGNHYNYAAVSGIDNEYFSIQSSFGCDDSELDLSETETDDMYVTADEGYEADIELCDTSDTNAATEQLNYDIWHSHQPASRYRLPLMHEGICRIIIEILIELSEQCCRQPITWSDNLAQLINRLCVIRDCLGDSLFLLKGFSPILSCNDVRLRNLQQRILELIVDIKTPDILTIVFGLFAKPDPPIDILTKFFHYMCISTLKKIQPHLELEFIPKKDTKNTVNVEPQTAFQIALLREYHRHCNNVTPLTRAPCLIPIKTIQLWHSNGFTISTWLQIKSDSLNKISKQPQNGNNDNVKEIDGMIWKKTHILSAGTDQAMLSIYLSDTMHLVFETCKPNQECQTMPLNQVHYSENEVNNHEDHSTTTTTTAAAAATTTTTKITTTTNTVIKETTATAAAQVTNSTIFKALRHTKDILLNSLTNMNLFNGPVLHSSDSVNFECSQQYLQDWHCQTNQWYHLIFSIKMQQNSIDIVICINGLEHYTIILPFHNVQFFTKNHAFQLIALGDGCSSIQTPDSLLQTGENFECYAISRISITNLILFNRNNFPKNTFLHLTAMGPDFTQLSECQVANWKPNYGYLNLRKMPNIKFGNFHEALKMLRESRVLCYTAQHPHIVMAYDIMITMDPIFTNGNVSDLILYGEAKQNVIPSLQSAIILSGGLSNLLYLFARVVEKSTNSESQAMALDILLKVAFSESQLFTEFYYNDYLSLIGNVIKTDRCTKDSQLLKSLINNACSAPSSLLSKKTERLYLNENTTALVIYPQLITKQLQRYSDWHRSGCEHSEPLELLLNVILALTREKHPYRDFNITQLTMAGLMKDLLNLCKVYITESPNPIYITKKAANYFLNIISIFAGSPPTSSLLDEIMKLLLLLHKPSECFITHDRSKFYYLLTNEVPSKDKMSLTGVTVSFRKSIPHSAIRITGQIRPSIAKSISKPIISTVNSIQTPNLNDQMADDHLKRQRRLQRLHNMHKKKSSYKKSIYDFLENLEINADCSNLNKNAIRLLNPKEMANFKWHEKYKRAWRFSTSLLNKKKIKRSTLKGTINEKKKIRRRWRRILIRKKNNAKDIENHKRKKKSINSLQSSTLSSKSTSTDWCDQTNISGSTSTKKSSTLCSSSSSHYKHHYHHRMGGALSKPDIYNSLGLITLQTGLLLLLKDCLCLLPDTAIHDVLHHYIKIEYLLVLANHRDTGVRTAILKLIDALTQRLYPQDLNVCFKQFYNYHLANQITINNVDAKHFEACLTWVTGRLCNIHRLLLDNINLHIEQRFGLNTLLAICGKSTTSDLNATNDFGQKCFVILKHLFVNAFNDERLMLIEAGLVQSAVKALCTLYVKGNNAYNQQNEEAIADLLNIVGKYSINSTGHINILWDIINMLAFYQQEKHSQLLNKKFRSIQAKLQLNWLQMFFIETNIAWNFKVRNLENSTLSLTEVNKRLELLINRSAQFFTIYSEKSSPSHNEIELFKWLISYNVAMNQRCNHFIAWGLQPSQPKDLRSFIVDALWIACQDDFMPSIICDNKTIKTLLWLSLLEDLEPPIKHLKVLCERLGIHENDTTWNLENELQKFQNNAETIKQKLYLEKTIFKYETLTQSCIESSMITTRKVTELQNAERKLLMSYMKDYNDTHLYIKWLNIVRRLTHEGAPWYSEHNSENSWELDDTEGPSRVHTRLRRCHLDLDKRFFMNDYPESKVTVLNSTSAAETITTSSRQNITINPNSQTLSVPSYYRPLHYLTANYDQQLNISLNSQILYNFPAIYLPVDGEIDGEIIITDHMLHFIATYHCKYFYINCDIADITEIWLKRYQHKDTAFELYLDSNQSLFFILQNSSDIRIIRDVFCDKIVVQTEQQNKLLQITQHWCEGLLTNWEYLMCLNQMAGRTYNDLMQYPVLPWILSNYTAHTLDLKDKKNFRDLQKPIAIQNEGNQQHYINNYTHIKNNETHIGSLPLQPYHYSSHYSNSGTVLHFLVRVPPFTSHFLRYQDNNFDIPDRTFHSISTTWNLASRDSSTDVKELIPEFFCLPEMFDNFENFNFGFRQNGERVNDVQLPPWCSRDPRFFILIHRQALETELVRNDLHHWIDLIFGYKQTGEAAIDAINVFHPVTYPSILDCHLSDPVERNAVQTMIKTYGQMPRQLFHNPHPTSKQLHYELDDKQSILSNVHGLRWGIYVGSPQLPKPTLGDINKLPNADYLLSFTNTNVIYGLPRNYNIMQGPEIDTYKVISWDYPDSIIRIQSLNKFQQSNTNSNTSRGRNLFHNSNPIDEISACGCEPYSNQLWFGHRSGRLSVYKSFNPDINQRFTRSRQGYVRGLRLSYNSALRKITTKSSTSLSTFFDLDHNDHFLTNGRNFNDDLFTTSSTATTSALTIKMNNTMEVNEGNNCCIGNDGNNVGSISTSSIRDGTDLRWQGPTILIRHTDEITCIKLSIEFKIVVTAGKDGLAVIWDLNNWSYIRTIERPSEIHHSPIILTTISPTMGDIVTIHNISTTSTTIYKNNINSNVNSTENLTDECFEVTEENLDDFINVSINPNGKSILRLHTINARYIKHIIHEERITAVCYSFIKEGVGVNVIATAIEGGIIHLWSSWNLSYINKIVTGTSNIKSLTYSMHQHLVVLTEECYLQVWQTDGLYGTSPIFPQIIYR